MYAVDFEFDGQYLSDYGFVICDFDGVSGTDIVSAGSKITFNTVSHHMGKKHNLTSTRYEECIQTTFSICKSPKLYKSLEISNDEYRDLIRWLNRREFLNFQLLGDGDDEHETCFFEASFNIDKIMIGDVLVGMELTMQTNKPFGYGQEQRVSWTVSDTTKTYLLSDISDEIGYIYPDITITINANGNLTLYNELENCTMVINNCIILRQQI